MFVYVFDVVELVLVVNIHVISANSNQLLKVNAACNFTFSWNKVKNKNKNATLSEQFQIQISKSQK